jgi:imidazolonepropionase-like amidohydrolase
MNVGIELYSKFAFVNVNVIAMVDSSILSKQTVLIKDGLIIRIGDTSDVDLHDYHIIDATDKYLIPSLIDMHVHLGDNEDDLLLFLINGVTTIRNMWGYENYRLRNWLFGTRVFNHLQLRNQINNGEILGPTIYTASPMNEGENPFFPKFMVNILKTEKQAEQIVKIYADKGYDLIKFYSTISKDIFNALVYSAKKNGISIAGHVPDGVGIEYAVNSRVTSIEHLFGFFNPYNPKLALQENEIPKIADLSAQNNVYHCPTLIASERISNVECRQEYENEPEMNYLPTIIKKGMRFLQDASNTLFKKKNLKPNHDYIPYLFNIIQELKKHNAKIILGTDKATPYVIAGFSVHRELKLLCNAGLTPFEAIQSGTINAAQCLNKIEEIGTIEVGKRADLLLTNNNPLINLDALRTHCGVMIKGKWISRKTCDLILEEIKNKNN